LGLSIALAQLPLGVRARVTLPHHLMITAAEPNGRALSLLVNLLIKLLVNLLGNIIVSLSISLIALTIVLAIRTLTIHVTWLQEPPGI
jgi:hypothetical protein